VDGEEDSLLERIATMTCPNCNSWVAEDNLFCTYCGAHLEHRSSGASFFWWLEIVLILALAIGFYLVSSLTRGGDTRVSSKITTPR
jgi:zinc ribbon protein